MPGWVDDLGDAVRQTIRAYHGSPYDFDGFDASKIGAGEGAQSYGHGLYFAGNEGVARSYRDKLSPDRDVLIGGLPSVEYLQTLRAQGKSSTSPEWTAVSALREYAPEAVDVDDLFSSAVGYWPEDTKMWLGALDNLRRKNVALGPRQGRMYEVEVGHPEDSLLDYDSPFGKNSGVVAAEVLASKSPGIIPDQTLRAIQDGTWASRDFTYGDSPLLANRRLQKFSKTPEGAAALLDAGIPGIRYLDGMSRSAGEGTRNYVMFPGTEDSIRILRKYGWMLPATMAAGAAVDGQPVNR